MAPGRTPTPRALVLAGALAWVAPWAAEPFIVRRGGGLDGFPLLGEAFVVGLALVAVGAHLARRRLPEEDRAGRRAWAWLFAATLVGAAAYPAFAFGDPPFFPSLLLSAHRALLLVAFLLLAASPRAFPAERVLAGVAFVAGVASFVLPPGSPRELGWNAPQAVANLLAAGTVALLAWREGVTRPLDAPRDAPSSSPTRRG